MRSVFFLLFVLPLQLCAQKMDVLNSFRSINGEKFFRVHYDNDFFASLDRNYTQGVQLELILPAFLKNPVNYLFLRPKNWTAQAGLSLSLEQYTPEDIGSALIQLEDRPYAAVLSLESFRTATDTVHKAQLGHSLQLGVLGPAAFGVEVQTAIHRGTNNVLPLGWHHQIRNALVVNYRMRYEKQLFQLKSFVGAQGHADVELGTLHTRLGLGTSFQVGWMDSPYSTHQKKVQCFLFAQTIVHAVAYDATLQGGWFANNPYTIAARDIERFTGQINYGIVLKTRGFFIEYTMSALSREFSGGVTAMWGGLRIGFGL